MLVNVTQFSGLVDNQLEEVKKVVSILKSVKIPEYDEKYKLYERLGMLSDLKSIGGSKVINLALSNAFELSGHRPHTLILDSLELVDSKHIKIRKKNKLSKVYEVDYYNDGIFSEVQLGVDSDADIVRKHPWYSRYVGHKVSIEIVPMGRLTKFMNERIINSYYEALCDYLLPLIGKEIMINFPLYVIGIDLEETHE